MALSPDAFAAALPGLRPQLLQIARCRGGCQPADAEDLVSEAVRLALLILPQYNPETGPAGLAAWLTRILKIVMMREREKTARTVPTVPIETAATQPAPLQVSPDEVVEQQIRYLPDSQRYIVRAWLQGDRMTDIARDHGVHRNTVFNRLQAAFHTLRADVPPGQFLTFTTSDFDYCRRQIVYRRPLGAFGRWRRNHPADIRFKLDRRTRSGFSVRKAA